MGRYTCYWLYGECVLWGIPTTTSQHLSAKCALWSGGSLTALADCPPKPRPLTHAKDTELWGRIHECLGERYLAGVVLSLGAKPTFLAPHHIEPVPKRVVNTLMPCSYEGLARMSTTTLSASSKRTCAKENADHSHAMHV